MAGSNVTNIVRSRSIRQDDSPRDINSESYSGGVVANTRDRQKYANLRQHHSDGRPSLGGALTRNHLDSCGNSITAKVMPQLFAPPGGREEPGDLAHLHRSLKKNI